MGTLSQDPNSTLERGSRLLKPDLSQSHDQNKKDIEMKFSSINDSCELESETKIDLGVTQPSRDSNTSSGKVISNESVVEEIYHESMTDEEDDDESDTYI